MCSWPAATCDLTCHVSGGNRAVAVGLETHKAPFKASTLGKVLQRNFKQRKKNLLRRNGQMTSGEGG